MATRVILCPVCDKPLEQPDVYMVPIERPYMNIYFHRSCYKTLGDEEGVHNFVKDNLQKLIKIYHQK